MQLKKFEISQKFGSKVGCQYPPRIPKNDSQIDQKAKTHSKLHKLVVNAYCHAIDLKISLYYNAQNKLKISPISTSKKLNKDPKIH